MTLGLLLALVGLGCLAAGILAGRYYVPDDRMLRRTARHARSYARAASRILEGEPDGAIEELKQVVAENVDDVEPYFALGALFRGRGDWERAIRIHQAISAREPGNKPIQVRALYALGLDFRGAGMPRRATRAMEQCLAMDGKHEGALQAVAGLYEEQGRYEEAAESLHRLHKLRGQGASARQHHLLVAAAQRAVHAGELDRAKRLLRDARRIDEHSVHSLAAAAELAAARGDAAGASARLQDALRRAPELAGFLIPGLVEAERQLVIAAAEEGGDAKRAAAAPEGGSADREAAGEAAARAQLQEAARRVVAVLEELADPREPHLQLAMAELRAHDEPALALEAYRRIADSVPGLLPARVACARLALAKDDPAQIRAELVALVAAGGALAWATEGSWRCSRCGHRRQDFFWRCEPCRTWGTARLDLGRDALEPPPPPPWALPGILGGGAGMRGAAERALPVPMSPSTHAPAPPPGIGARTGAVPTMLGRVGAWFAAKTRSRQGDGASPEPRALARENDGGAPAEHTEQPAPHARRALARGNDGGAPAGPPARETSAPDDPGHRATHPEPTESSHS